MNHVSLETAKRLEEAGFPQPELSEDNSRLWWCLGGDPVYEFLVQDQYVNIMDFDEVIYAPTATELLPDGYKLVKKSTLFLCRPDHNFQMSAEFYHENPHEAAAQAWLHVKSKA